MTIENVAEAARTIKSLTKKNDSILIQWHGGEPTALGSSWFEKAIETLSTGLKDRNIENGIQTNLILLDDKWVTIFKKYFDSKVGISWDPEIRHLKNKKNNSNKEYENKFWPNVSKIIEQEIEPFLVITLTKKLTELYPKPRKLIDFLVKKGIRKIHLERITKTGYARDNWTQLGLNNLEYSRYLSRLFLAYKSYEQENKINPNRLFISPLDGLKISVDSLLSGGSGGYGCLSGVCDNSFHTIDSNGYKKGCTALTSEMDNKRSTASDTQVINIIDLGKSRSERQQTCEGCQYLSICSSGCLAIEKFDGSGECSGGKLIFETMEHYKGDNHETK